MKWTDTQRIAEELYDLHGDSIDPKTVRFTQLRDLIMLCLNLTMILHVAASAFSTRNKHG